jgi:nucleotide-binding universal stress UspA family protein
VRSASRPATGAVEPTARRRTAGVRPAAAAPPANPRTFVPIRRILCPVDFSDFSRAAVDRAVALARPTGAEITALFVLPFVFPDDVERCSAPVAPEPGVQAAVAEDLEEFLRPASEAGLPIRFCVRSGDCVLHILEEARARESDLIVMGTHGLAGFERWVLGSVTDRVLRLAPCPVMAVPRRPPPGPLPGRIVCAVPLTIQDQRIVPYVLSLGRSTGSAVTLVHVSEDVGRPRAAVEDELRRRLHAAAVAAGPTVCSVEEVVFPGQVAREVVRLAGAQGAGLVVMGGDDRDPGPTVRRILRAAAVPVLVVRTVPPKEAP